MKGIVFTEFIEMVEEKFGWETAEEIIESANLDSNGAYTAVGTYSHTEMIQLVVGLSSETGLPVPDLIQAYGDHLFQAFVRGYPQMFEASDSAFHFLQQIQDHIHVEVQKLYVDAELPHFAYDSVTDEQLVMTYRSERPFADLAHGLIGAAIRHYKEDITVERENLNDNGTSARFTLTKVPIMVAAD